jgi:hypothetical protein
MEISKNNKIFIGIGLLLLTAGIVTAVVVNNKKEDESEPDKGDLNKSPDLSTETPTQPTGGRTTADLVSIPNVSRPTSDGKPSIGIFGIPTTSRPVPDSVQNATYTPFSAIKNVEVKKGILGKPVGFIFHLETRKPQGYLKTGEIIKVTGTTPDSFDGFKKVESIQIHNGKIVSITIPPNGDRDKKQYQRIAMVVSANPYAFNKGVFSKQIKAKMI